jgi:uncharacterized membrane protein
MYRYRNSLDLVAAAVIALLASAAVAAHLPAPVTVVLGIGLFFAPGYVWSEVILSHRLPGVERVAVAAGVSLLVPILGGFVVYAAGIALHRPAWVGILATATLVGVVAAAVQRRVQRRGAAPQDQPGRPRGRGLPVVHMLVFAAAAVVAIAAIGLSVVSAGAQKYPGYTPLWMTPIKSEPGKASLGVTNEQGGTVRYELKLMRKGKVIDTWDLTMVNGQTWQLTIPYTLKNSEVADLYRLPDVSHPYVYVDNGE